MSHLAIFEWAFRTFAGRRESTKAFARLHYCSPHPKNQEFPDGMKTLRYGSVCFLPRSDAVIPVKAYLNWWSNNWLRRWFYYQVSAECLLQSTCQRIRYVRCPTIED